MATCGINVSMSSLQGVVTTQISSFLNLRGTLGGPAGIAALTGLLPTGMLAVKSKLLDMLPEIPISTSAFSSLRDDLQSVVSGAGAGLTDLLTKYGGLTNITGLANVNLLDLANSAISLSANFDPCSLDIPNILSDADGGLDSLAAMAPSLGSVTQAGKNILPDQSFTDLFAEAQNNITTLTSSMPITEIQDAISSNIQQAKTFSDGAMRKGLDGVEVFMQQSDLKSLLENDAKNMINEETMSYV